MKTRKSDSMEPSLFEDREMKSKPESANSKKLESDSDLMDLQLAVLNNIVLVSKE